MTAYGTVTGCPSSPLRCDDPVNDPNGVNAPTVMSTYSLQTIKSYVGSDTTTPHPDYSYSLSNSEGAIIIVPMLAQEPQRGVLENMCSTALPPPCIRVGLGMRSLP